MKSGLVLIAFTTIFIMHASDKDSAQSKTRNILSSAFKLAEKGSLVVCHSNDNLTVIMKEKSKQAIAHFREYNKVQSIDYILTNDCMHDAENGKNWVSNWLSINNVVNHQFYQTPHMRGIVVYTISYENGISAEQHRSNITALMKEWPVIVYRSKAKKDKKLEDFLDSQSSYSITEESDSSYMSRLLVVASVVGLLGYVCYKFFMNKN